MQQKGEMWHAQQTRSSLSQSLTKMQEDLRDWQKNILHIELNKRGLRYE